MEIEISFKELQKFLTDLGFLPIEDSNNNGIVFGKISPDKNLFISIGIELGKDNKEISCRLRSTKNGNTVWELNPTKKTKGWEIHLGRRIEILEELIDTARTCPSCNSNMIPSIRIIKPFSVFWNCARFPDCLIRRETHQDLQKKLAKETKLPKKVV